MVPKSELTVLQCLFVFGTFCNIPGGDFLAGFNRLQEFWSLCSSNSIAVTLTIFFSLESDFSLSRGVIKEVFTLRLHVRKCLLVLSSLPLLAPFPVLPLPSPSHSNSSRIQIDTL